MSTATLYEIVKEKREAILKSLYSIVVASGEPLEGNAFYEHGTMNVIPALYTKQLNLFWCGLQGKERICEIGFNAGHSFMLMLLGRDTSPIKATIFDIGHHTYTKPALECLKTNFPHVGFEYIEGDSTVIMPKWIESHQELISSYDVIHVDGGHSEHCISNDMKNADILLRPGGIMIVDDVYFAHINKYVDQYIQSGNYKELELLKSEFYTHRILQKIDVV
jgi:predicted O-methyltransferase YrrM